MDDSPSSDFKDSYDNYSRDFSASMYLMWRHTSTDSIWVPINVTKWGYYFRIVQAGGEWGFQTEDDPDDAVSQDTTEFPKWNSIYENEQPVIVGAPP